MKKTNLLTCCMILLTAFTSCKLNKMVKLAQENELKVEPSPLEVHNGTVAYEMSATLPPKILPSNTSFILNSIYVYGEEELTVGATEFKAEDFPNSSTSVAKKSENFSFPYQEGMNPGTLYVEGVATDTRNGKSKMTDRLPVAQGLVLTSTWVKDITLSCYEKPTYSDKEELIPTNTSFYFDQGRSTLRNSLTHKGVTNLSATNELNAFIAERNVTKTVTITGTHSPEGRESINSDLSKERAATIEKFYRAKMKKYDYKGEADSINFILKPVVQDWNNFRSTLASYDGIDDEERANYLKVIDGYGEFADKEKELQKLSSYKKVFKDIYPGLRSALTEVLTVVPKKSNAEIAVLAKSISKGELSADTLSEEELMFSATLTPSVEEKAAIFKAAANQYGTWQAHNNLAAAYIELAKSGDQEKLDAATTQLEIATSKNPNAGIIKANMAAVLILQKNYEEAYNHLNNVSGVSNEVNAKANAMKGAIQTRLAEYDKAKTSFNTAAASNATYLDQGLANLLSKDFEQAEEAFQQIPADGEFGGLAYYLRAVVAARQKNTEDVTKHLLEAVKIEPSLKEVALNDIEFTSYSEAVNNALK